MALSLPIMRAAAIAARQSIHLAIFDEGESLVLAQVDAQEDSGYFVKPGTRRDVFLTASGRILLAFQTSEVRQRMLAAAISKGPELMAAADLERRLDIIRFQGFEEMPSLQISGVHNFSFPVMDTHGHAVAAMTMPFLLRSDLASGLDDARKILREAAAELSRSIGYSPESDPSQKA